MRRSTRAEEAAQTDRHFREDGHLPAFEASGTSPPSIPTSACDKPSLSGADSGVARLPSVFDADWSPGDVFPELLDELVAVAALKYLYGDHQGRDLYEKRCAKAQHQAGVCDATVDGQRLVFQGRLVSDTRPLGLLIPIDELDPYAAYVLGVVEQDLRTVRLVGWARGCDIPGLARIESDR